VAREAGSQRNRGGALMSRLTAEYVPMWVVAGPLVGDKWVKRTSEQRALQTCAVYDATQPGHIVLAGRGNRYGWHSWEAFTTDAFACAACRAKRAGGEHNHRATSEVRAAFARAQQLVRELESQLEYRESAQ